MTAILRTALILFLAMFPVTLFAQTTPDPNPAPNPEQGIGLVAEAAGAVTTHTDVQTGAYILRLSNVSPRDGSFDVDMWLWFRWNGADVRPDLTFELANGVITSRSDSQVEDDGGINYATVRVQATIFHDFDVRRYPLDNHVITIALEDAELNNTQLSYTVDQGIALDPAVTVAGWKVALQTPNVEPHVYDTNYGLRSAEAAGGTYSRFSMPISLDRTSYGPLFKAFWISALAVLLGLLAFLIKADDLDARFGMGVGSIFAASANAFVISDALPPTTAVTLAEQINLIAVGVIFTSVFISIWSLRLRYADREADSLSLDRTAMWVLGLLYLALNALVMTVDLS
ncbi:MAG: hypothetical protein H7245_07500 [Candidatus Saccharibacteria bacterium]|nr:hypothetical protein [Pseudorhodobacter sp.]